MRPILSEPSIPSRIIFGSSSAKQPYLALIESYLFDYEGNAYGKNVKIQLYEFRRPEKKFASVEEMRQQVESDISYGREYFRHKRG